jgi:hypothetical protein
LIDVEPAWPRAPATPQILGHLALAAPPGGQQDRLATGTQTAVSRGMKGVFSRRRFVVPQVDGDHRATLPD